MNRAHCTVVRPLKVAVAQLGAALQSFWHTLNLDFSKVRRIRTVSLSVRPSGRLRKWLPPWSIEYLLIEWESGAPIYVASREGAALEAQALKDQSAAFFNYVKRKTNHA